MEKPHHSDIVDEKMIVTLKNMVFSYKTNMCLPYDPIIALLVIHPTEMKT